MSSVVCFYHADCNDGWCAAWLVKKAFPDAELVPVKYSTGLPKEEQYAGRLVYIVDFSYSPDELRQMAAAAFRIVMIDHHKTAVEKWAGQEMKPLPSEYGLQWLDNVTVYFDVTKSGAMLTWEFLSEFPYLTGLPGECPLLVQYIQDRDLWKWELPDSKAADAYIRSHPKTVDIWDILDDLLSSAGSTLGLVDHGYSILRREQQIVNKAKSSAAMKEIAGYRVPVVNTTELISEVGHALCEGEPFAVMYQDDLQRMKRVWSFRSDGGVDVAAIAAKWGGGGHRAAAGATTELNTVLW
jgi:oligoribonuclease NrnB/cAMP/cGMP phosphodiesterase (DHH superfamily)